MRYVKYDGSVHINSRKTVINSRGDWWVKDNEGKIIPWTEIPSGLYTALSKLLDYENTGLSPYQIARLVNKEET